MLRLLYTLAIALLMVSRLAGVLRQEARQARAAGYGAAGIRAGGAFVALLLSYPWEVLTSARCCISAACRSSWLSYNRHLHRSALAHLGHAQRPDADDAEAAHVARPAPEPPDERPARLN